MYWWDGALRMRFGEFGGNVGSGNGAQIWLEMEIERKTKWLVDEGKIGAWFLGKRVWRWCDDISSVKEVAMVRWEGMRCFFSILATINHFHCIPRCTRTSFLASIPHVFPSKVIPKAYSFGIDSKATFTLVIDHFINTLSDEKATVHRWTFCIPPEVHMKHASEADQAHTFPLGYMTIYKNQLIASLKSPYLYSLLI
ncbi:hypothetical protein ACH5RR_029598 [Cinchona calisaya]|uniref:Uncharacterized protein n=1 Tax=Cinchona calisaya TaxID=153742 RepID=A0ABD2YWI9_9GENT